MTFFNQPEFLNLSPSEQALFMHRYSVEKKNTFMAYVLFFLLGFHYLYLGFPFRWILYEGTFGGCFIWALVDFFSMPFIVREANYAVSRRILRDIQRTSVQASPVAPISSPSPSPPDEGPFNKSIYR